MARFSFFGDQEHRVFNYKPRFYDPEEEERRQMFGKVDGSIERENKEKGHTPGSYIQGSFRNGNYSRRRGSSKAQTYIGIIGLLLVLIVLIYIAKFYQML